MNIPIQIENRHFQFHEQEQSSGVQKEALTLHDDFVLTVKEQIHTMRRNATLHSAVFLSKKVQQKREKGEIQSIITELEAMRLDLYLYEGLNNAQAKHRNLNEWKKRLDEIYSEIFELAQKMKMHDTFVTIYQEKISEFSNPEIDQFRSVRKKMQTYNLLRRDVLRLSTSQSRSRSADIQSILKDAESTHRSIMDSCCRSKSSLEEIARKLDRHIEDLRGHIADIKKHAEIRTMQPKKRGLRDGESGEIHAKPTVKEAYKTVQNHVRISVNKAKEILRQPPHTETGPLLATMEDLQRQHHFLVRLWRSCAASSPIHNTIRESLEYCTTYREKLSDVKRAINTKDAEYVRRIFPFPNDTEYRLNPQEMQTVFAKYRTYKTKLDTTISKIEKCTVSMPIDTLQQYVAIFHFWKHRLQYASYFFLQGKESHDGLRKLDIHERYQKMITADTSAYKRLLAIIKEKQRRYPTVIQSEIQSSTVTKSNIAKLDQYKKNCLADRNAIDNPQKTLQSLRDIQHFANDIYEDEDVDSSTYWTYLRDDLGKNIQRFTSLADYEERMPQNYRTLLQCIHAGEQEIQKYISHDYSVSGDMTMQSPDNGYICFHIQRRDRNLPMHQHRTTFKTVGRNVKMLMRPSNTRQKARYQSMSASIMREDIRGYVSNIPPTLYDNAPLLGISKSEVRLVAMSINPVFLDYFRNNAGTNFRTRFERAARILNHLRKGPGGKDQKDKYDYRHYDEQKHFAVEQLLTIADLPYAEHIVAAVGDGSMENLGYPSDYQSHVRNYFDIQKDHGMLLQVHQNLVREIQKRKNIQRVMNWQDMKEYIQNQWVTERENQYASFENSPDFVDGEPKEIVYVHITTANDWLERQEQIQQQQRDRKHTYTDVKVYPTPRLQGIAQNLNAMHFTTEELKYKMRKKQDLPGKAYQIHSGLYTSYSDYLQGIRNLVNKLRQDRTKFYIFDIHFHGSPSSHGNPGNIGVILRNGKAIDAHSSDILRIVDSMGKNRMSYIKSCHAGSHLKEFKRGSSSTRYLPRSVAAFNDNKSSSNTIIGQMRPGYRKDTTRRKDDDGHYLRKADINGDGRISINEMNEFINTHIDEQDMIHFNEWSEQIGMVEGGEWEGEEMT